LCNEFYGAWRHNPVFHRCTKTQNVLCTDDASIAEKSKLKQVRRRKSLVGTSITGVPNIVESPVGTPTEDASTQSPIEEV
jgi:hypothetical protein